MKKIIISILRSILDFLDEYPLALFFLPFGWFFLFFLIFSDCDFDYLYNYCNVKLTQWEKGE